MPPSISDVARKAGVSTATVSRTFRTPDLLNVETHERVMEAARSLNYTPRRASASRLLNPPASVTASRFASATSTPFAPTDAIGFQFFSAEPSDTLLGNSFYARILSGAQAEAARHGCHLLIHTTDRHALTRRLPRMVEEKTIGGMLLVGTTDPDVLSAFAAHVPHLILVDNRDATGEYESVISDGFTGAYEATRHLIDLGHTKIGFVCNDPAITTFKDRQRGFLCAQMEAGISPHSPDALGMGEYPDAQLQAWLTEFLARPDRPTALIAANDHHAFVVLRACRALGLSVPHDLSIIGFDDVPMSQQIEPALTTVRFDTAFMGALAVRRLLTQITQSGTSNNRDAAEPAVCSNIPVALIERASCAPPLTA